MIYQFEINEGWKMLQNTNYNIVFQFFIIVIQSNQLFFFHFWTIEYKHANV